MTDSTLFDGASDTADLEGYGPIPAEMARDLLRHGRERTSTEADCRPGPDDDRDHEPDDDPGLEPAAGPGNGAQVDPDDRHEAAEPCTDGARCTSWDCTMLHGVVPRASTSAAGTATASADSDSATDPGALVATEQPTPAVPGSSSPPDSRPHAPRAAKVWLRRLYADPSTGVLIARDPRRRTFTGSLRAFLIARDQTCRNSWCGAPIRDIDHIRRHRDGGPTDADNGRGLCHRCNLARERERHHEPPPDVYRPPPPLVTAFLGSQRPRGPSSAAPDEPRPPGRQVA